MRTDPAEDWHLTGPAGGRSPYEVLKAWENLRLVYNAVLIPWVLLGVAVGRPGGWADPVFWEVVIGCGLGANVCFCLGPVAEAYLVWGLGVNPRAARVWLFALGTGFTALASAVLIGPLWPNQN